MPVKCTLLYRTPKGTSATAADQERIKAVLLETFRCVPEGTRGHASKDEKQMEALVHVYTQIRAPDESALANPVHLRDVWAFRLAKEASSKNYLMLRSKEDVPSVTEADASIRSFLERRLGYKVKDTIAIQSIAWSMGDKNSDVTIKMLTVTQNNSASKGLALEVTHHPACDLAAGGPESFLGELVERIIDVVGPGQTGSLVLLSPEYSRFKADGSNMELPPMCGPIHTVVAYKQLLEEVTGVR